MQFKEGHQANLLTETYDRYTYKNIYIIYNYKYIMVNKTISLPFETYDKLRKE